MLTIYKSLSANQAQNYHRKKFTAREQTFGPISGFRVGSMAKGRAGQTWNRLMPETERILTRDDISPSDSHPTGGV